MSIEFLHQNFNHDITIITAPMGEQIYLVKGKSRALLIDTGMGIGSLKEYVKKLTDLPIVVIDTHGHPDHAGGNGEFDDVFLNQKDEPVFRKMCLSQYRGEDIALSTGTRNPEYEKELIPFTGKYKTLVDGQEIDLGGRKLIVVFTPGHTPGSICLYEEETRSLFAGDTVTSTDTWMHVEFSLALETYYHSLLKLEKLFPDMNVIYPGHKPVPIDSEMIKNKLHCAKEILYDGKTGIYFKTFAGNGLRHQYKNASIIYNPMKLFENMQK